MSGGRRQDFLKRGEFTPYSLLASDLPIMIEHYRKKYGINIIINGQSANGQQQIALKQQAIQKKLDCLQGADVDCDEMRKKIKDDKANCCLDKGEMIAEVEEIKKHLKKDEAIGYIFTNGNAIEGGHFEVIIITQDKIIKPLEWQVDHERKISASTFPELFLPIHGFRMIPQASLVGCGTLGLIYLKELLKNGADQLNQKSLVLSGYRRDLFDPNKPIKWNYFIPSPQVLRYSEMGLYNQTTYYFLMSDEVICNFSYKEKEYPTRTLRSLLTESIGMAKQIGDATIVEQNTQVLNNLPMFREMWEKDFKEAMEKRNPMRGECNTAKGVKTYNQYLTFKTRRMEQLKKVDPPTYLK